MIPFHPSIQDINRTDIKSVQDHLRFIRNLDEIKTHPHRFNVFSCLSDEDYVLFAHCIKELDDRERRK